MNTSVQRESGKKWERARGLGALLGLALVLGLGALFAVLAEDVWLKQTFAWDALVALAIHRFSTPWLDSFMDPRRICSTSTGARSWGPRWCDERCGRGSPRKCKAACGNYRMPPA